MLEQEIQPAVEAFQYPGGSFTKADAVKQVHRIREAIGTYAKTESGVVADEAMLEIMRAVGTQNSSRSLYGGAGGSTDRSNPGNPAGQRLSSAADKLRQYARKEHERLKSSRG
jgi:hypothetical protein